jgi:hypothetical protein
MTKKVMCRVGGGEWRSVPVRNDGLLTRELCDHRLAGSSVLHAEPSSRHVDSRMSLHVPSRNPLQAREQSLDPLSCRHRVR